MRNLAIGTWLAVAVLAIPVGTAAETDAVPLSLRARDPETRRVTIAQTELDPKKTAVVVVDMWDNHWCKTLAERTAELVPHMNMALDAARGLGIQVVFAPSDVLDAYREHPARKAMQQVPEHPMPEANGFDPPRPPWGRTGGCECGPDRPCKAHGAWKSQHPDLAIKPGDLIGDCNNSRELANLCRDRGFTHLIYMGVHTNMCVCYRGFGMVSMKRLGFQPILVRDLTDAAAGNGFDPDTGKPDPTLVLGKGTDVVVAHIEAHIAPTITSTELTGKPPFRFKADRRPHGASANLIPNGDFREGNVGGLPEGWTLQTARPSLAPVFRLVETDKGRLLMGSGGGNADCVGYVRTGVPITLGKTYRFAARFRFSDDVNPQEHLLFQCFGPGARNGLFEFRRLEDGWVEGEAKIQWPGEGSAEAEIRVLYRLNPDGKVWVRNLSLEETEPVEPRWVKVACTRGKTTLEDCHAVLDAAGKAGVDLVLLTEYMQGGFEPEPVPGPSSELMSAKAKEHAMYVAGGIVRLDEKNDRLYNTALLYDRRGNLVGTYDKLHPYSPELNEQGITPGTRVPVFETDFGKVAFMICYDSWFTDVAQLAALKGAELILFPNAGYYRSLMPARAADNCVRIVASSWNSGYGVWDTVGREVLAPEADPTYKPVQGTTFKDAVETQVGPIGVLTATLDMNCSPSPAYNGGTMYSAPGGKRNRGDQRVHLEDQIQKERSRWWVE